MGEIPIRRKTKVSSFDVNQNRVSRVLRCSRKAKPMANGLIFPYPLMMKAAAEGAVDVREDGNRVPDFFRREYDRCVVGNR